MDERSYTEGQRAVWRKLHRDAVRELGLPESDRALVELEEARAALRSLAGALDLEVDWPDDMHLVDMVEDLRKHLA